MLHEIPGRWLRASALDDGYADVALQPLPGPENGVSDRRGAVLKVNRAAQSLLGSGSYADVSSESAEPYRLRDAATGRDLPTVDVALMRALRGEPVHDLRVRMFLPALGRDAAIRIDAQPLVAAEGMVRGVVAAITEVVQGSISA